jgi:hypothetical protein
MSAVVIAGDTSGAITLQAPAVSGTTTVTIPATTGNFLLDTTTGVCRAWVNFNGTGTVAIRASYNVTSITDNGTGNYTVNFTTSMTDANYSVGHAVKFQAGTTLNDTGFQFINSSSNIQVFTSDDANVAFDFAFICVQVFR